jgi:hypothetical protein
VTNEVIYSIQEMISEELAAAKQAEILATTIERGGEAGQGAMRQLMMMGEGGIYAIRGITTAGEQARQKIEAIRQSALDAEQALAVMAQDFTKQILQIQGDQRALLDIEHQERLRQLDELYQKSGQYGAEEYRDAKSRAEQLHQMKLKQMADEQAADQTAERFSKTAEQAERLNRAMGVLADASLANVTRQADALHQTLSAVNNLL